MLQAYISMFICILIWGSNFVASSWLVQHFNPLTLPAIRLSFTSFFLIGAAFFMHKFARISKMQLFYLLAIGLIGTLVNQLCFFQAVTYTSPTEAALIMSMAPIATCIFAYFLLHERITKQMVAGSVLAIIGVYLLVARNGSGLHLNLGYLFAFGAMISFSLNLVLIRKLSHSLDSFTITVYCTLIGTCMFYPVAISSSPSNILIHHSAFDWIVLILSAVMSQGLGGLLWNRGMTIVGATKASIITNLQPFVAMITGYLFLGLPVTHSQIIGGIIIIAGVLLATLHLKFQRKNLSSSNMSANA